MFAIFFTDSMDPFYYQVSTFPTIIFTILLTFCIFYWLVALLGMIEIDVLDFDLEAYSHNPNTGSGEAPYFDALAGLLLKLGLDGVPVTIIISIVSLVGWIISYYLMYFLTPLLPFDFLRYLVGLPIFAGITYVALLTTAVVIKPLKPLFKKAEQVTQKTVLGQVAIIKSSKVTDSFGEAFLEDGGAGLVLKIRSSEPNEFKKGDSVVLLEYLDNQNAYRVISEEQFNN